MQQTLLFSLKAGLIFWVFLPLSLCLYTLVYIHDGIWLPLLQNLVHFQTRRFRFLQVSSFRYLAAFLILTSASNVSHFSMSVMVPFYFLRPFAQNIQRFSKIFDLGGSFFCVALFKETFDLILTVDVDGLVLWETETAVKAFCVVTIIKFTRMT